MDNLCSMSPESVTMLATSIAVELSKGKSPAEILALRNVANQVTASLYTIYSQQLYLQTACKNDCGGKDVAFSPVPKNNPKNR